MLLGFDLATTSPGERKIVIGFGDKDQAPRLTNITENSILIGVMVDDAQADSTTMEIKPGTVTIANAILITDEISANEVSFDTITATTGIFDEVITSTIA